MKIAGFTRSVERGEARHVGLGIQHLPEMLRSARALFRAGGMEKQRVNLAGS